MKYVIVRAPAGHFAGNLESKDGSEVVLVNVIRLYQWEGATLSQLAMEGIRVPEKCKFPMAANRITILGVIEILDTTKEAEESIKSVPSWKE